jgi:hypothetical protein
MRAAIPALMELQLYLVPGLSVSLRCMSDVC